MKRMEFDTESNTIPCHEPIQAHPVHNDDDLYKSSIQGPFLEGYGLSARVERPVTFIASGYSAIGCRDHRAKWHAGRYLKNFPRECITIAVTHHSRTPIARRYIPPSRTVPRHDRSQGPTKNAHDKAPRTATGVGV